MTDQVIEALNVEFKQPIWPNLLKREYRYKYSIVYYKRKFLLKHHQIMLACNTIVDIAKNWEKSPGSESAYIHYHD